ncbi:MAG: site-specific integrase [Gallionella sp.]|nr:site-specific integrase [Gallionella sp.]
MASKRNRGTSWEYIVQKKGVLAKPVSLSFPTEKEGDAYCAHLEKLLDAGIVPEEFKVKTKEPATLGSSISDYIKSEHITDDDIGWLRAMESVIGSRTLDRVNYLWADGWVKDLKVMGGAPSTIRKKVGALARCLDWVVRRSDTMLAANPLRMLPKRYATTATGRKDVERDRRLCEGEEARILSILSKEKPEGRERALTLKDAPELRLMFILALETAMRMREIYTLTKDQIDLGCRTIFLEKTKNGSKRQVPMSSVAISVVKEYLTAHSGDRLFTIWNGDASPAHLRYLSNKLSSQWSRIFSAAGCQDLRFHDLRHEAVSRMFERTKWSDVKIAKVSGHTSTKMLMRYANLRASDLAESMW